MVFGLFFLRFLIDTQRVFYLGILESLSEIYTPTLGSNHNEEIDLTIHQLTLPNLNAHDQDALIALFTRVEINEAMFDIHCSKSPGPDGITA